MKIERKEWKGTEGLGDMFWIPKQGAEVSSAFTRLLFLYNINFWLIFQGLLGTKAFKALYGKASHYQQPEFSCHLLFSPFSTPFATGEYFLNVCCKDAATTFKKRGSGVFSVWDSKITNFKLRCKFLVCFLVCFILEMTPIKLSRTEIYVTSLNIDFWDCWLHG